MFGFLQRSARPHIVTKNHRRERPRLLLEQLEDRLCPAAPVITQFSAVPLNVGQTVQLSGTVQDENPGTVTISFSGVVSGGTVADASGHFTYTATASGLGTVSAHGWDQESLPSNTASDTLVSATPSLTLNISYGNERTVILSGTVTDEEPGGRTVTFSGVVTGSTTTNADGTYSYTADATALGAVQATTSDPWGQASNTAEVSVTSQAPTVSLSLSQGSGNTVTLSGTVSDESPGGRTVTFGGVVAGSTTTNADGTFSFATQATALGVASAITTDPWGQSSNSAEVSVTSQAPSLTLAISYGNERTVTLTGTVTDEEPGGRTVTFSGVVTGSTTTNADGTYSYTADATALGAVQATTSDPWGQASNTAEVSVTSQAPTVSLSFTYGSGRTVSLSGMVTDESAGGRTVTLTGVVNTTVVTNADGSFSITTEASALGDIQASTTDPWGLASNTAQVTVASNPPTISNFQVIYGFDVATFQGQVTDESVAGLVVQLGGIPSLSGMTATVDSSGWFSLTVQLQPGEKGTATAQTTDWWGLTSNQATTYVEN